MYIDAHVHTDGRSFEDLELMAVAGIEKAVTHAHDVYRMSTIEVYTDHYDRLLRTEVKRAKQAGLELYVALGIHPGAIPQRYENLLEKLPELMRNEKVIAIGETGLQEMTKNEVIVLERQIEIAIETNFPILIHTPKKQKSEALEKILTIIQKTGINPEKVLIDHIDTKTVEKLHDSETYVGLSIQPSKLSIQEGVKIIDGYRNVKFVLNSDLGSYASDPLALPKTALFLKKRGMSEERIYEVCYENALKFYNL